MTAFFIQKGLAALKDEDRAETWYGDWIAYQAQHELYARLLSPKEYSQLDSGFDLLRYARFLEVMGYFSPAHGYSLQVTFLGLTAILAAPNTALKREAVRALEAGGLLAFGVSEQGHGSDLLGNEFTVAEAGTGRFVGCGTKYYIGNANVAAIIAILGQKKRPGKVEHGRRVPVLFAFRPLKTDPLEGPRKVRTLGVRAAFVGDFAVKNHEFPAADLIAEGREAWDSVFSAVTLGKFFLGFGSIGICEHAFAEASAHLSARVLYGRPATEMPHLRATLVHAYARLTAMKLYAYRALDYLHSASAADRRYLLFAAVQKAKVSTEGVKVMSMLSECIGARGFESETYFEMALRDVQLIPGLEGSTHINLGLVTQFMPRYFAIPDSGLIQPPSLVGGEIASEENAYLWNARTTDTKAVSFPDYLQAYRPLMSIANVRLFAKATKAFEILVRSQEMQARGRADSPKTLALGECLATIAFGQLIAENAVRLRLERPLIAVIFQSLMQDWNAAALTLATACEPDEIPAALFRRMVAVPRITADEYDFVAQHWAATSESNRRAK